MENSRALALTITIFFFTSGLSGSFLPIYLKDIGLGIPEIVMILLFTFIIIGVLPFALLKLTRHFERIISFGILLTLLFYLALIYVKNPIILGLAYGLGIATFWPSFNLLMFRLSESSKRAVMVSLLSVTIPSITGIISPAVGGYVIEKLGFTSVYISATLLYLLAFAVSFKIRFKSEVQSFSIPKNKMFIIFSMTFILFGFTESYWLAYPLFVFEISSTILNMGLVVSTSALIIALVTVGISRISDVRRTRIEFAMASAVLYTSWYFALTLVSNMLQIVILSLLSGLASAFGLSWFAYYGDSFERKYHASILVLMEVGLMIGRTLNLAPTLFFLANNHFPGYFTILGCASLLLIPLYVISKRVYRRQL